MSCSCVVLASDQACTREYITHGRNGLLCDFFNPDGIAEQAVKVLKQPADYRVLGTAARLTIEEKYSLDVSMPRIKAFFERVAAKRREPSVRVETLIRPGTLATKVNGADAEMQEKRVEVTGLTPGLLASVSSPLLGAARPQPRSILFCWELGGGLGHVMQILPLADALVRRGHRVFVALRQLKGPAARAFERSGALLLQAPCGLEQVAQPPFRSTLGFGHILGNIWSDGRAFAAAAVAWRNLFVLSRPDVILFDHSPTALVASRGLRVRRALIGSGFCCPPDTCPLPALMQSADPARLEADEQAVLRTVNRLLVAWKQPPMDRVGRLYSQVDDNFLTTLRELEQYPSRKDAKYWGPVLPEGGEGPEWPKEPPTPALPPEYRGEGGRRVFAYLKRFDGLEGLAAALRQSHHRTLLYVDGLAEAERRRIEGPNLHVTAKRVDLRRAAAECDAAVLHAGQGATAAVLLQGKPILQIPLVLEQRLTADATARLGAGEVVTDRAKDPAAAVRKLDLLLTDPRYTAAARGFERKYSDFNPAAQVQRMVGRVEELIEQRGRGGDKERKRQGDTETRGQGERAKVFAG
jgi:UDP:flavonoid glycosyltransferase YjiC (YdhE family)